MKRRCSTNLIRFSTVAVSLAALAVGSCRLGEEKAPAPELAIPVRVETVHLESAGRSVRYAAVVRPRIEADVGFRVPGKMMERRVNLGDRVAVGTVLARLDTNLLDLAVRGAEARLASARAEAANTLTDFFRYGGLRRGIEVSQQQYDRQKTIQETTAARVQEVAAALEEARNNVEFATLRADGPGVVTAILAEPSQVVTQGQTIFRIARFGEIEVTANLPEDSVALLPNARMSVEFWSLPGIVVEGRLREIAPSADPMTRTYEARVTLVDPPPEVRLGMTAVLLAAVPQDGRVAVLPLTALTKNGNDPAVLVLNRAGDEIELRPVTVGAYSGDNVILRTGLAEGERVVTAGVYKLNVGQKVRIWTEPVR